MCPVPIFTLLRLLTESPTYITWIKRTICSMKHGFSVLAKWGSCLLKHSLHPVSFVYLCFASSFFAPWFKCSAFELWSCSAKARLMQVWALWVHLIFCITLSRDYIAVADSTCGQPTSSLWQCNSEVLLHPFSGKRKDIYTLFSSSMETQNSSHIIIFFFLSFVSRTTITLWITVGLIWERVTGGWPLGLSVSGPTL